MARAALGSIQGKHYNSYVHPKDADLGKGGCEVLEKLLKELPDDRVIIIERATIAAMKKKESVWLHSLIDMESEVDLLPEDPRALSLVRAKKSKNRLVFGASYFMAMAEETCREARFSSVKAFLAFADLLQASGNLTVHHVQRLRRILKSFLMRLSLDLATLKTTTTARHGRMQ
jgi:hypothetical protein